MKLYYKLPNYIIGFSVELQLYVKKNLLDFSQWLKDYELSVKLNRIKLIHD